MKPDADHRLIFEKSPQPMWVYDCETLRFLSVNEAAVQLYGFSRDEFLALKITDICPPEEVPALLDDLSRAPERLDPKRFWKHRKKDGTPIDVAGAARSLRFEGRPARLVVVHDVTERSQDQEEKRRVEGLFRALVEHSSDGIALVSRDGTATYTSASVARVLGYSADEFVGKNVFDLIHPGDIDRARALFAKALELPGTPISAEVRCRHRDGSWRDIECVGVNRFDDPAVGALVANYRDITDRKLAQEALRRSEERFRLLADNSFDLVGLFDASGKILYASPSHYRVLGRESENLVHASLFEVLHPDDTARALKAIQAVLQTRGSEKVEVRLRHISGDWVAVEAILSVVLVEGDNRILFAARDTTERRRMEDRLRTSHEQLRALSSRLTTAREEERTRIAREIHDELGQRLMALKMELSSFEQQLSPGSKPLGTRARTGLELVEGLVQRVRDLATELRPAVLDQLGLETAVRWQAQEFQARTSIRCRVVSRNGERPVEEERATAVFRVLQETLTNVARHADASHVVIHLTQDDRALRLQITDDGRGISAAALSDPKSLGLLGMRERIRAIGGTVEIERRRRSQGTMVRLRVPHAGRAVRSA